MRRTYIIDFKKLGTIFSGKIFNKSIIFLISLLIIKYLPEKEYGIYITVSTIITMFSDPIVSALSGVINRFLPFYLANDRENYVAGLIRFGIFLYVVSVLILLLINLVLASLYKNGIYNIYFYLYIFVIPCLFIVRVIYSFFIGLKKFYISTFLMDYFSPTIYFILIMSGVFLLGKKAETVIISQSLQNLILSIIFSILFFKYSKRILMKIRAVSYDLNSWISFGFPIMLKGFWKSAFNSVRIVILDYLLGPVNTAYFRVSFIFMPILNIFSESIKLYIYPNLVEAISKRRKIDALNYIRFFMRWISILSFILTIAIIFAGEFLLKLIKPSYIKSYYLMLIFNISILIEYFILPLRTLISALGFSNYDLYISIVSSVLNPLIFALFIKFYGLTGGMVSYVVSSIIYFIVLNFFTYKVVGKDLLKYYDKPAFIIILIGIALNIINLLHVF